MRVMGAAKGGMSIQSGCPAALVLACARRREVRFPRMPQRESHRLIQALPASGRCRVQHPLPPLALLAWRGGSHGMHLCPSPYPAHPAQQRSVPALSVLCLAAILRGLLCLSTCPHALPPLLTPGLGEPSLLQLPKVCVPEKYFPSPCSLRLAPPPPCSH